MSETLDEQMRNLRNIGIMAHIDAGKTTTTERILFYTGENHKIGNVDDGNTTTDWMEQEKERGITIQSAAITCSWKGKTINIIDTPGHVDFSAEVERSLRVLDGAVAVFCAVGGVEAQSETVWRQSLKYNVPKIAFINKMDRMGADYDRVCDEIKEKFNITPLKMTIPVGSEQAFSGVIDVLGGKYLTFSKDDQGSTVEESEIPDELKEAAKSEKDRITEEACTFSDALMEKFFAGEEISADETAEAIRAGVLAGKLLPVFAGSSLKNIGVQPLLDGIISFLPSPSQIAPCVATEAKSGKEISIKYDDKMLSGLVFKVQNDKQLGFLSYVRIYSGSIKKGVMIFNSTRNAKERAFRLLRMRAKDYTEISEVKSGDIAVIIGFKNAYTGDTLCEEKDKLLLEKPSFPQPVISVAIECESTQDNDKLMQTLEVLAHEDPTFVFKNDADTGQTIISGMGELHLDVLTTRIKDEFNIKCNIGKPQITHKESVQASGELEETYSRTVNDKQQAASVRLSIKERKMNGEYAENVISFDKAVAKSVSKELCEACEEQLAQSLMSGIEQGYECTGMDIEVKSISADPETPTAVIAAATAMCFDKLSRSLSPVLLEPLMNVTITTPDEYTGDCITALTMRSGTVECMESKGGNSQIKAAAPLKNLFGFATALRSSSQGKANFSMEFRSYS